MLKPSAGLFWRKLAIMEILCFLQLEIISSKNRFIHCLLKDNSNKVSWFRTLFMVIRTNIYKNDYGNKILIY